MTAITCPHCHKQFRWTPQAAGRNARCSCGRIIQCPSDAPFEDPTAYALAPETAPAVRRRNAPPYAPAAPAPIPYRSRSEESIADPETIKNIYMPLWLLAGGVVFNVIAAMLNDHQRLTKALMDLGLQMLVSCVLITTGMLLAAKPRGINLGRIWIAIFKIAAISVAPPALIALFAPLLEHIPFGMVLGWIVEFVFYFALLGALFDLDESDTWYCVCVIFIVQVAAYFLVLWALSR
jgi:hypothetical protein